MLKCASKSVLRAVGGKLFGGSRGEYVMLTPPATEFRGVEESNTYGRESWE